jgi:WD40 repeat protein
MPPRRLIPTVSAAALCGGLFVSMGACAPPWTVRQPASPPRDAIVTCQVPRCETLCGFLPDGRIVAWTLDRAVVLCDPDTGRQTAHIDLKPLSHAGPLHASTGRLVAFDSQSAELWALLSDPPRRVLRFDGRYPGRPIFSPDGALLALGDYALALYDAATGNLLREIKLAPDPAIAHARPLYSPTFSGDGKTVAAVSRADAAFEIVLWSVADAKPLYAFRPATTTATLSVDILGMSHDGRTVLLRETHQVPMPPGPSDGPVRMGAVSMLYDAATGARLGEAESAADLLSKHGKAFGLTPAGPYWPEPTVSPDGRFAVTNDNYVLSVAARDSGKALVVLDPKRHLERAWAFLSPAFSPDSRRLAFLHDDTLGVINLHRLTADH